jgi:hypothetical protein
MIVSPVDPDAESIIDNQFFTLSSIGACFFDAQRE